MKHHLEQLLGQAIAQLCQHGVLPDGAESFVHIARSRDSQHGDFASNSALTLAKSSSCKPHDLAAKLLAALPDSAVLEKTEIAGAGFINFFVTETAYQTHLDEIRQAGERYGYSTIGAGQKVLLEFVSANPTGPLHVGHGRGAAYGDALSRVLRAAGYQTSCEYYLNDAGRQMDILALSVWLRYLEYCAKDRLPRFIEKTSHFNQHLTFPANAYQGEYVRELSASLYAKHETEFNKDASKLWEQLPQNLDADAQIDALVAGCKSLLGEAAYQKVFTHGSDAMAQDIRQDLREFGVCFDNWFSEKTLHAEGEVSRTMTKLEQDGHLYEKDGAQWFKASDFGDEKDRAVCRANGAYTYFAADIAYHANKGKRGFDKIVDVLGADHHGYAQRITAACQALGYARTRLQVVLVQFAVLYRDRQKIQMSTRGGDFVTLRELRNEVGNDAARFFYVSRKNDQHIDFDIDLAKTQSADNPVYYIQYAHARICSVFAQLAERNIPHGDEVVADYTRLVAPQELELMKTLSRFPEVVEQAANGLEPHLLTYYLRALANDFHAYYNAHPFLASEAALRDARLGLIDATRQVIANGLGMLGVSAPQKM